MVQHGFHSKNVILVFSTNISLLFFLYVILTRRLYHFFKSLFSLLHFSFPSLVFFHYFFFTILLSMSASSCVSTFFFMFLLQRLLLVLLPLVVFLPFFCFPFCIPRLSTLAPLHPVLIPIFPAPPAHPRPCLTRHVLVEDNHIPPWCVEEER